jgi:hypothetical protein
MVRRVLSVLALLPLLLPPGLCVCHAPTAACTTGTARHVGGDGQAPLAHLCLAHDCDGDHHDGSDPSGGPHRHAPGCPALLGLDHWAVRPGVAVQAGAPDVAGSVVPFDTTGLLPRAAARLPRLDFPDGPPPVYLTLRTLLI